MAECCGSGGADVGEIADRVARHLVKKGFAKPSCLAGVGGHVSGFIASARGEVENIVIDGCPVACARKTMEHIDAKMTHYVLTEMGLEKGKTSTDDKIVNEIAERIFNELPGTVKSNLPHTGTGCACGTC